MNKKEENIRERAMRRLRQYLLFGSFYLAGATAWLVRSYATGRLESRTAVLWLLGSLAYILGMALAGRHLRRIAVEGLTKPIGPDERQDFIAGKAAHATLWWSILVLVADLAGTWANTGRIPLQTALFLLLVALFYSGHYVYYLRKYS